MFAAGIALSLSEAVLAAKQGLLTRPDPIEGYRGPIEFGNATINAPLDENGRNTYIGMFV